MPFLEKAPGTLTFIDFIIAGLPRDCINSLFDSIGIIIKNVLFLYYGPMVYYQFYGVT